MTGPTIGATVPEGSTERWKDKKPHLGLWGLRVPGVGGMFGAVATGVLATGAVQAASRGLIAGNPGQVLTQVLAVGATIAYAVLATFAIVKLVDLVLGLRISIKEEELGIDLAVHGEVAYQS